MIEQRGVPHMLVAERIKALLRLREATRTGPASTKRFRAIYRGRELLCVAKVTLSWTGVKIAGVTACSLLEIPASNFWLRLGSEGGLYQSK